jgi:hypothetical protein
MSYLRSVPKGSVDALTWLGKRAFFKPSSNGYIVSEETIRGTLYDSQKFGRQFFEEVGLVVFSCMKESESAEAHTPSRIRGRIIHFHIASQVLATGQKTLLLSQAICESFEQTDVTVPFREYRQPFQTMVIELPAQYAENTFVPGAPEYPTSIALYHDDAQRVIAIDVNLRNAVVSFFVPYDPDEILEDAIQRMKAVPTPDAGFDTEEANRRWAPFFRIAFNAMLAMTYGVDGNKVSLARKQQQTKKSLQKRADDKNKFVAHRARLHLAALPTYFQFDQKIKAFDEQHAPPSLPSNTTGSPKKPHWRRGHWRQQRVGQGRVEQELRWIRPMLIRADRFGGDLKDTTTTYTT